MAPTKSYRPLNPSYGRVAAWLNDIDKGDSFQRDTSPILASSETRISVGDQSKRLDSGPTCSKSKKRKRSEADIMSDADEDRRLAAKRNHYYVQHPPTTPYEELDLEAVEGIRPIDIISQSDRDGARSTGSFSPSKSMNTTITRKKRREMLDQCLPKFEFFGVSGQGGLNPDDEEDEWKIPSGFETLVHTFRASMALRGSICTCVEERIRGRRKFEWWEEGTFLDQGNNHQRHLDEANFVIQSATRSEGLQLSVSEEADWAGHATEVLRFVAGVIDSFHPVTISSVTTVDIHHDFFPTLRKGPRSRSTSPTKRQRGNVAIREPAREVLAARADISVNLRRKGKQTKEIVSTIQQRFGEFPTPFKTIATSPLLAVEAKSHDGSALEAEFQAIVCANAILEAWRQLGASKIYTPPTQKPNSEQLIYPTIGDTELFGIDHVIALQVVSFSWFYSIVFAGPKNDPDQESRKVLGPFLIGDSRQFTGTYSILRFLETLFTYKVSVWLPGMIQRGER
ncbi:hypothetical protein TWF481_002641 [Arthrobotrys musiformis]|uniref:PD-(D/E)XK nuclease-like domain-containing protein n=1 Tax=Arthrobotrys musiformis TaxID=47236 RepID=A0AAV9VQZ9_9PEZI